MAIKDAKTANNPDTMRALVGEKIAGIIVDYDGRWWIVVESGHALVVGVACYWTENPKAVRALIAKRKRDLGQWTEETKRLMDIEGIVGD